MVVQQNLSTSSMDALAAKGRRVRLVWSRQHNRPVDEEHTSRETPKEVPA